MKGRDCMAKNKAAGDALKSMKRETAKEMNINLKEGYNGDIAAKDAGKVGGNMTKKLVDKAEQTLSGKNK